MAERLLLHGERPTNPSVQGVHLAVMYSPIKEVHYGTRIIETAGSKKTFLV